MADITPCRRSLCCVIFVKDSYMLSITTAIGSGARTVVFKCQNGSWINQPFTFELKNDVLYNAGLSPQKSDVYDCDGPILNKKKLHRPIVARNDCHVCRMASGCLCSEFPTSDIDLSMIPEALHRL